MDYTDQSGVVTPINKKCKGDESDQSESEEDSDDDYVNQFTLIYPSHRNKEEDYEKYF